MKKLYRFVWDWGRHGRIEGIFVATQEEMDTYIIGKYINFGSALGKHSECYGTMEESFFTVLTEDQEFIEKAEQYGLTNIGYDPFYYIEECDE